jgi:hypothetical protein
MPDDGRRLHTPARVADDISGYAGGNEVLTFTGADFLLELFALCSDGVNSGPASYFKSTRRSLRSRPLSLPSPIHPHAPAKDGVQATPEHGVINRRIRPAPKDAIGFPMQPQQFARSNGRLPDPAGQGPLLPSRTAPPRRTPCTARALCCGWPSSRREGRHQLAWRMQDRGRPSDKLPSSLDRRTAQRRYQTLAATSPRTRRHNRVVAWANDRAEGRFASPQAGGLGLC